MSWQQPTNGNWNLNVSNEETLRATRFNAQRNGSLGQLSLNEQLALQNMGGASANNPYASQQGLYSSQMLSPQAASLGGLQGGGLMYGGNVPAYGRVNHMNNQASLGVNGMTGTQANNAVMALIQQQMLNLQQNTMQNGYHSGQANLINNNLQQALALAQQQSNQANMRQASLASNPQVLALLSQRLNQQQMLSDQTRLFQQQLIQQRLHAIQQQQQLSSLNALFKTGGSGGFDGQVTTPLTNQGMNLAGFSSTGLANSALASAPLLPILGTDLAKPSQRVMHEGIVTSDVMKQMEALSLSGNRNPSVSSLNDVLGRTQAMSPTGFSQKDGRSGLSSPPPTSTSATSPSSGNKDRDLTTLKTLGQMLAKTGNTVESAVQNGLLGGCNAEDVKIVWEAYVLETATLKQYDEANKAFQRQGAELVARRAKSDDPEATKMLMEAAKAPPASLPSNLAEALHSLGMEAPSGPPDPPVHTSNGMMQPKSKDKEQEGADPERWDGVIENESHYVPHHIINEVNTSQQDNADVPKKDAFNAGLYGFFEPDGDGGVGDILIESDKSGEEDEPEDPSCAYIENPKSEENNFAGEDGVEVEAKPSDAVIDTAVESGNPAN